MRLQIARSIERSRSRARTLPLAIVTGLLYALGFRLLHPAFGAWAGLSSLPFVGFWAWRSGAVAGVAAGLVADLLLRDIVHSWAGARDHGGTAPIASAFLILDVGMGVALGRLAALDRRLGLESEGRARAEARLRESEECHRVLFESNPQPMWVTDGRTMKFLAVNAAALEYYGYSAVELDRGPASFILPGKAPRPDLTGVHRHRKKDGTIIDVELAVHPITFRGREARLVLATDVTEHKRAQAELAYQAHHDPLTGLPNRASFRSCLERAFERSRRSPGRFAVFLLDLDRFKEINDTMGHTYGDRALQQIGPRLQGVLREGDLLARLGGDEFGVFLPKVDEEAALRVAGRLLEAFRDPFVFGGRAFDVGASVGIALHPGHGDDVDALLHRADLAMYASKRSRGGAVVYSPAGESDEPISIAGRIADDGGHVPRR